MSKFNNLIKPGPSPTVYEVKDVVDDYGVYAHYKYPEPHSECLIVCNSRANALLIKDIMDCDKNYQVYHRPEDDEDSTLDTANGNILGYLDERFHAHYIEFNTDGGYELLEVVLDGFGRLSKPTEQEMRAIDSMMATEQVRITRTLFGIQLWSVEL